MPLPLTLPMDDVYLRAGRVAKTFPLAAQLRPDRPLERLAEYGLLIHWPRAMDWLRLSARVLASPTAPEVNFAADLAGLDAVCLRQAVTRGQLAPTAFLEQHAHLAASLLATSAVELVVTIDTDAAGFRAAVAAGLNPASGHLVLPVQLRHFDGRQFRQYVDLPSQVNLSCTPCKPLPRFAGAMAIDLGNAVTSVAALAATVQVRRSASVTLVGLDLGDAAEAKLLASAVRLDTVRTPRGAAAGTRRLPSQPSDDLWESIDFAVGRVALTQPAGAAEGEGLVLGVKQLLSVPEPPPGAAPGRTAAFFALNVRHLPHDGGPAQTEQMEVMNHFAGELIFAHAFSCFRAEMKAWPADVALTYPTTYTRGELRQLVTAAVRGWLRTMQQPQAPGGEPTPTDNPDLDRLVAECRGWLNDPGRKASDCPLVRLTMDEATAAAFFHVQRRVFEKVGALVRFRYLHPRGLHALVVDCGGGTTDVVLVHASADDQRVLKLDVLARTGVRTFGGDNITHAVCRLVKAKLAALLARVLHPAAASGLTPLPAAGPADPAAARDLVGKFLDRAGALRPPAGGATEYVPTRFDPKALTADSLARQAAFRALWQLAEELKRKLADGKPVKFSQLTAAHLHQGTSALMRLALPGKATPTSAQVLQQLGDLAVAPWEVDALVRADVEALADKCNRLMRDKLRPDAAGLAPEVDWVVLSGNAARYPLVKQLLCERLQVAGLSEGGDQFTFDPDNLKHAVAKGAAIAQVMGGVADTASVKYARELSELLPYEVGVYELHTNSDRPLFREFTRYDELHGKPHTLTMQPSGPGRAAVFVLRRKFPGDKDWSDFAAYTFREGLVAPAQIVYDDELGRFVVTSNGEESAYEDRTEPLEHVSLQNRGDL